MVSLGIDRSLHRLLKKVQMRGGARRPHARRTLCTLSVRPRAPTKQMAFFRSLSGMGFAPDQVLELRAEFLDVADVRTDRAVVEGANGRPRSPLRHVENGIEIFLAPFALDEAVGHLVDPARSEEHTSELQSR